MATAAHLDEAALWQHALGLSAEPERALAEVHLAGCAACRAQLARAVETVALLPMALTSVAPPVELRARLLGSMAAGRFARHVDALAALFDIDRASSARQLGRLDDESAWKPGPLPGLRVRLGQAGPACAGAYTGFLRLAPAHRFPAHGHHGPETTLVLAGGLRQHDGRELHAGQSLQLAAGDVHDFVALPGEECVAAVVQRGGLEFGVELS